MDRRGPEVLHDKREAYARLISEGVPSVGACRIVGINPRTGKRWRNGRRDASGPRVVDYLPVITTAPTRHYSPSYPSEDERVVLADLRRRGTTSATSALGWTGPHRPSAVSSGAGRTMPGDTGRLRRTGVPSGAAACAVPAASSRTQGCATGSRGS
jgi:hypothetical protein